MPTPLQATLVIAAFYAAQILAAPWLGKLSDRFGRRPILIISQIGTIFAYLMFFFAAQLGAGLERIGLILGLSGGLMVIYLARILDGLTGGNVSVAEAYASDISDERSRTQALGLIGGAIGVGHILGPALAAIHAEPTRQWTVDALARKAAASRSVLAARFVQRLNESPMRYLTQWRLQLAIHLLRSTELAVAVIAGQVGYQSEAAFSRMFKRHLGLPPAVWRERHR